jgi:hypothetical protein
MGEVLGTSEALFLFFTIPMLIAFNPFPCLSLLHHKGFLQYRMVLNETAVHQFLQVTYCTRHTHHKVHITPHHIINAIQPV